MRYTVTFLLVLFSNSVVKADDSQTNPVASKIKIELQKKTNRKFDGYYGYCDLMIEMEHKARAPRSKK